MSRFLLQRYGVYREQATLVNAQGHLTKVQGKICFKTKFNDIDQTFWILYFLCVFGFLTYKAIKD